jgi:hypothetical protein
VYNPELPDSKLGSGKTITEENVIACIQEHCESKKQVKKETKKSSSKTINKQEKVKEHPDLTTKT